MIDIVLKLSQLKVEDKEIVNKMQDLYERAEEYERKLQQFSKKNIFEMLKAELLIENKLSKEYEGKNKYYLTENGKKKKKAEALRKFMKEISYY